jgi:uncharacterized protein YndB with AHSA1/START domain
MSATIGVAPVRKRVRVNASPERAFDVFAGSMGSWWPKSHSLNKSPIEAVVIEPRNGGRWFERGEDGSECPWGHVLAWEPPARLLLAWQLNTEWTFDPALVTELEIRFSPDGDGTVVELEHRMEGYGEAAEKMRQALDGPDAWEGIIGLFAKATP